VYCWLQEKAAGTQISPFTSANKFTVAVPAAGFTVTTEAGAVFNGDLVSSTKTFTSIDVTAKINKDNKKLECIAITPTQASNPTEEQWDSTMTVEGQKVPNKRQILCPTKDTACTLSVVYLNADTTYKMFCRPEGVADSTKSFEFKTDVAPVVGTETNAYTVVFNFAPDMTVDAFNGNNALKTAIQEAIKKLLKLPATATVKVSAAGTAGRKFATLETKLKITIELGGVKRSDSTLYFNLLKQSQASAALTTAVQAAATAAGATVTITTTTTAPTDNQSTNNTGTTTTGDDDSGASSLSMCFALVASVFFLFAWL
jgi:hypothetical protein